METTKNAEVQVPRKLPLWKHVLEKMEAEGDGLHANKSWPLSYFEKELSHPHGSAQLMFAIAVIQKALRRKGWVLSSRGHNATEWVLLPRDRNADAMLRLQRTAINALREGVILGTSTPMDALTDSERQRHEAVLEKLALRSALLSRRSPQQLE